MNCYATGAIKNGFFYSGGIVGVSDENLLQSNFALNREVNCDGEGATARVFTVHGGSPTLNIGTSGGNNYAYVGTLVNGVTVSSSDPQSFHGQDISYSAATTQAPYENSGWDFSATGPWTFDYSGMMVGASVNLPILRSFTKVEQNPILVETP